MVYRYYPRKLKTFIFVSVDILIYETILEIYIMHQIQISDANF